MKDKIYEEYGIKVNYLIYKKNCIFFDYNDKNYMITKSNLYEQDLSELSKIVDYADNYGIFFHKIILNQHGYLFEFGQNKYVLLELRVVNNRLVSINEILKVSSIKVNLNSQNVLDNKVDFLEKYLANYENLNLQDINYFIGLSENAIELFNIIGTHEKNYLNHKRIDFNETTLSFYNPLNITIDFKTRDLAEYAKSLFVNGNNQLIQFLNFFDYSDYITYFARLLYPSFYFDFVDQYINNDIKMDEKRIRDLANSYEQNLRKLYAFMSMRVKVPNIEWLSNVNNF